MESFVLGDKISSPRSLMRLRTAYSPLGSAPQNSQLKTRPQTALQALEATHALLLGGAPLDRQRHIWWNFVSSSRERIERARDDWRHGRFGKVPGDETEFIPLPPG